MNKVLGDIAKLQGGYAYKSRDLGEVGLPVVKIGDVTGGGSISYGNMQKIPLPIATETERFATNAGDTLISMTGANVGKVARVGGNDPAARINQRVGRFVPIPAAGYCKDYIHYIVSSKPAYQFFANAAYGSAQPNISGALIESLPVPEIEPDVANKIGKMLASLDDKIELNRRMNETLEEMARALFRDWFVDFGPTRRQMEGATGPAAIMGHAFPPEKAAALAPLFPAKLGEDGLPDGWEERQLDEIGHFLNGLALQKFPAKAGKPDLPVIKIAELRNGVTAKSNRASNEVPQKYVIDNGDFIFSWSGSLMAKFWTGGAGALNQHLFKVTSESHPMWFVSEWVQTHLEEFQRIAASKAVTMGHIKRSHLAEAMCVCPPDEALASFGEVFDPLISKQIANDEENQILASLRDLLLPKLMSGEICLKDAED
jgi:type I restriction enzyme S subunit